MSAHFDFDEVDAFTVGAIGRPGERTFFLQVRRGGTRVTLKCEKQQAAAIAEHLRRILHDLPAPTEKPLSAAMELTTPVEPVFVLGTVGLGYDPSSDRVLLQLEEVVPFIPGIDDDLDDDASDLDDLGALVDLDEELEDEFGELGLDLDDERGAVRVFVTRDQAHAFCAHTDSVVAAGRPPCIWCNRPVDPDGHPCVRMN